jgi:penicillin V acylase-like amidase (Ntn superfamily)
MCTNFKTKKATDGSVVIGRSLEFPTYMPTALAALPSNHAGVGVGRVVGLDAIAAQVYAPLKAALPDLERRDEIERAPQIGAT